MDDFANLKTSTPHVISERPAPPGAPSEAWTHDGPVGALGSELTAELFSVGASLSAGWTSATTSGMRRRRGMRGISGQMALATLAPLHLRGRLAPRYELQIGTRYSGAP